MGKKVLQFGTGVMGVSAFISLICIFLPMHRTTLFVGPVSLGTLTTYTLKYHWLLLRTPPGSVGCGQGSETWYCSSGSHDLLHLSESFCNTAAMSLLPELCEGFKDARNLGISMVLTVILQIILQVVALWLNFLYTTKSPKKKYRDTSLILMVLAFVITWLVLMFYYFFVVHKLHQLHAATVNSGFVPTVLAFSKGSAGLGFILLWVATILQIIATSLFRFGKVKEERMLKEAKNEQQFEAEMAMHSNTGHDPFMPASWGPGHGQAPGFGQPFAQQGYGPQGGYDGGFPAQQGYGPQGGYDGGFPAQQADPYAAQYGQQQGGYAGYDQGQNAGVPPAPYDPYQQQPGGAPYWPAS